MIRLITLFYLCGTWVNLSAWLQLDIIKVTSTDSSYTATSFLIVLSLLLVSILLAALVHTLALPVKVSDIQWYTHRELVCNFLNPHRSTRLISYSTASSSARLICAASFIDRNQPHPFPIRLQLPRS